MTRRLFALVLAAGLVVGAFFVRREVIEGDDTDASDGDRADELVCVTELADVCTAYAADDPAVTVTIEDAGTTLDRLAALGDDADAPLWLTVEPYPAMTDSLRASAAAEPLDFATTPLGASQLGVALPPDGHLDVLTEACATEPLWRCIGDGAGRPWTDLGGEASWGTMRPAFGDVSDSAIGLSSFAASVAGYFGDTEVSRTRWESDENFITWVRRLAGVASGVALSGGSALSTMATRPSALDIAATAGFELATVDASGDRFAPNYPAPEMWLQAVLAVPGGAAAPGDLATEIGAMLRGSGWEEPAAATPSPSASTMLALRAYWEDAT